MNWRKPELKDLETLQECAVNNSFFANNYSAVNSLLYEKKFHSLIATDGNWIFEKYFDDGKQYFSFPHNRSGKYDDLKSSLELLEKEAASSGQKLIFQNTTLEEKDALVSIYPSAKITATPESGDYIYSREKLSTLAGKKLSRKRNHIHQFKSKHPDFAFELLSANNLPAVKSIEEKWLEENKSFALEDGSLSDLETEKEIIFYALDNFETFSKACGMTGGILFAQGEPVAFCIASNLSLSVTDVHFEKCLHDFGRDGGYAVINNEFVKTVQTEFINREEDLGIEGLRKAKLSYYPEQVLEKFLLEVN
ncbi:MAG: phosphatidylglycerol lysyltransferase domain-containing protein [Treponema sp.]|nr:phosphatidylglycerol lysyltransferase domain-containing protein [Treponema sp.]